MTRLPPRTQFSCSQVRSCEVYDFTVFVCKQIHCNSLTVAWKSPDSRQWTALLTAATIRSTWSKRPEVTSAHSWRVVLHLEDLSSGNGVLWWSISMARLCPRREIITLMRSDHEEPIFSCQETLTRPSNTVCHRHPEKGLENVVSASAHSRDRKHPAYFVVPTRQHGLGSHLPITHAHMHKCTHTQPPTHAWVQMHSVPCLDTLGK